MKYSILESSSTVQLEEQVNERLKNGWLLHGSPSMAIDSGRIICIQAMVKEDSPKRFSYDFESQKYSETDSQG